MARWIGSASASGTIERRIRIETKTTAKSLKAECLAYRADRSGPSDDGNQTCGVMIHKKLLFGGEQVPLFNLLDLNVLHTHTTRRAQKAHKAPRIIHGGP
jgi:hypothetical protein